MPEESVISFERDTPHILDLINLWQEAQLSDIIKNRAIGKYGAPALGYATCLMRMHE